MLFFFSPLIEQKIRSITLTISIDYYTCDANMHAMKGSSFMTDCNKLTTLTERNDIHFVRSGFVENNYIL